MTLNKKVVCSNKYNYGLIKIFFFQKFREPRDQIIEQVGSIDPMVNERDEKLVALNLERIQYWLGEGIHISRPASAILGKLNFIN